MPRPTRSLAALPLAVALSAAALAAPASAIPRTSPDTIPLVTGSMPEGISAGPGSTFFVGARSNGAVYTGDVRTGALETLVAGDDEGPAVGLLYDAANGRLWVAGGTGGDVTAYDAQTGAELFSAQTGEGRFLNDVAITQAAVYVTDSFNAELIVIPTQGGALPAQGTYEKVALTGDFEQPSGFGANGIRALPDGELLLVSAGVLYTVTSTGIADAVEVRGRDLTAGDGLVLCGTRLYVVNGYGGDEVAVLRLAPDVESAQALGVIRDQELDRPTTGALIDGSLYVVNGRFGTLSEDPDAPVYVTRLRTQ